MRKWLAAVLGLSLVLAQGGTWERGTPMSEGRQEVGVALLNGKIYVAGGFLSNRDTSNKLEAFDPTSNTWQTLASMPIPVNHPATVAYGGKIWVLGGFRGPLLQNPTEIVQIYDPVTDGWIRGPSLPTPRGGLIAVVLDGKIYAIGGAHHGGSVGEFTVLDPATNRWQSLPPMPTPRDHLGADVIGGKIYAVGGRDGRSFTLAALEVYDPATRRWQSLPPMPTGRSGHAVVAKGTCLFAFGGEGNRRRADLMFPQTEVYSLSTNRWRTLADMVSPRHGHGAVVIGTKIYLPGGATVAGFGAVAGLEVFTPPDCN